MWVGLYARFRAKVSWQVVKRQMKMTFFTLLLWAVSFTTYTLIFPPAYVAISN